MPLGFFLRKKGDKNFPFLFLHRLKAPLVNKSWITVLIEIVSAAEKKFLYVNFFSFGLEKGNL